MIPPESDATEFDLADGASILVICQKLKLRKFYERALGYVAKNMNASVALAFVADLDAFPELSHRYSISRALAC